MSHQITQRYPQNEANEHGVPLSKPEVRSNVAFQQHDGQPNAKTKSGLYKGFSDKAIPDRGCLLKT